MVRQGAASEFKIYPAAAAAIESWLNTAEAEGGRPCTGSPFLLPSRRSDDGQLSVSSLTRLFHDCCKAADFPSNGLHNLHALRHYHAQVLYEHKNDISAISMDLGHSSENITKAVYIKQDTRAVINHLKRPASWDATSTDTAPPRDKGPPCQSSSKKEKVRRLHETIQQLRAQLGTSALRE